jgi:hypothetical protein
MLQRRQLHRKHSSAAAAEESLSPSHAGAPLLGQGASRGSFVRRSVRAWLLGSLQIRSASPSGTINHASTRPRSTCLAMSFVSRKAFWQKVTCQFPTKPWQRDRTSLNRGWFRVRIHIRLPPPSLRLRRTLRFNIGPWIVQMNLRRRLAAVTLCLVSCACSAVAPPGSAAPIHLPDRDPPFLQLSSRMMRLSQTRAPQWARSQRKAALPAFAARAIKWFFHVPW